MDEDDELLVVDDDVVEHDEDGEDSQPEMPFPGVPEPSEAPKIRLVSTALQRFEAIEKNLLRVLEMLDTVLQQLGRMNEMDPLIVRSICEEYYRTVKAIHVDLTRELSGSAPKMSSFKTHHLVKMDLELINQKATIAKRHLDTIAQTLITLGISVPNSHNQHQQQPSASFMLSDDS